MAVDSSKWPEYGKIDPELEKVGSNECSLYQAAL